MFLSPLAEFVMKLTEQPFSVGLANRKNFNLTPDVELDTAGISGADLGAFLQFQKGAVVMRVLDSVRETDPEFSVPSTVRDFVFWLYDYASWNWDPQEEAEYTGKFPKDDDVAQYSTPRCQIRQVAVKNPVATAAGKKIDLDIYGEGFLKGKTTVRILKPKAGGDELVTKQKIEPHPESTFRGGLLQLNATLKPGTYRLAVDIDLRNNLVYTIDTPAEAAKFEV